MKLSSKLQSRQGMTLIEITVVIALILGLISILLIGFNAYKVGADRAKCVLNISNMQKAVRSYANLNELSAGDTDPSGDLPGQIMGDGSKFIPNTPKCPTAGAAYGFTSTSVIPPVGTAFAKCQDPTYQAKHNPPAEKTEGW